MSSSRRPKSKSKRAFGEKTQPLSANGDNEYFDDVEFNGGTSYNDGDIGGYEESPVETTTVRCCGAFCMILLGVLLLSWIVHAIPVSTVNDIPPFARSMIWMSIAHHTDAWKIAQGQVSPPPPAFGDGNYHFPDVFPPPPPGFRLL